MSAPLLGTSIPLLYVISVIEVVLLVAILGAFLLVVAKYLRATASTLAEVTWGARAVERQLRAVGSNIRHVNAGLTDAATVLPKVIERAGGGPA